MRQDDKSLCQGAGDDACMFYDGSDWIWNAAVSGSGDIISKSNIEIDKTDSSIAVFDLNTNRGAGDQWRLSNSGSGFLFRPTNQNSSYRIQDPDSRIVVRFETSAPTNAIYVHGNSLRFNANNANYDTRIGTVGTDYGISVDASANKVAILADAQTSQSVI